MEEVGLFATNHNLKAGGSGIDELANYRLRIDGLVNTFGLISMSH